MLQTVTSSMHAEVPQKPFPFSNPVSKGVGARLLHHLLDLRLNLSVTGDVFICKMVFCQLTDYLLTILTGLETTMFCNACCAQNLFAKN